MENCKFNKNILIINGKEVTFQYEIDNIKKIQGLYIVLLDIPSNIQAINNVYAVNDSGKIIWQIENFEDVYPIKNDVPYVGTRILDNNQIIVTNFNGVTFTVNTVDGRIIGKGCTK